MYYNEKTKKEYAGKNVEILQATGLTGGFVTFRQAIEIGYVVPKGTKAVAKLNKPLWETVTLPNGKIDEKFSARKFSVFHVSQLTKEDA
jgi:antirestriction protein ArdC